MVTGIEVELKLRAEDEEPLFELASMPELGPAVLGPLREFDELDRYLDTVDRRLAEAGWACRLRTRGAEWPRLSLKGPARHASGAALHRRPEVEGPAGASADPADWPASRARDALLRLSGGRPLVERLALRQGRGERSVSLRGREVATLSLDRVSVVCDGMPRGRFLAVELEWRGRRPAAAGRIEQALLATTGLRPEPSSKLERALAMLGGGP
ncbi:MAG TPA: CYTH domain-containing protein [Candidatus Limnocylindria bacterium]|jgi:inorganic triphosphatase YgiF|nr:CYTH domain-containing protein [Candidatus Limnocylindria bacterium]